jgi:hypothetical protein
MDIPRTWRVLHSSWSLIYLFTLQRWSYKMTYAAYVQDIPIYLCNLWAFLSTRCHNMLYTKYFVYFMIGSFFLFFFFFFWIGKKAIYDRFIYIVITKLVIARSFVSVFFFFFFWKWEVSLVECLWYHLMHFHGFMVYLFEVTTEGGWSVWNLDPK